MTSHKAFDKRYPRIKCCICNLIEKDTATKRLVRDHDHITGMIRGWLCDLCNGRLGSFESRGKGTKGKVFKWATQYKKELAKHLKTDTGILYKGKTKDSVDHQVRIRDQKIAQLKEELRLVRQENKQSRYELQQERLRKKYLKFTHSEN